MSNARQLMAEVRARMKLREEAYLEERHRRVAIAINESPVVNGPMAFAESLALLKAFDEQHQSGEHDPLPPARAASETLLVDNPHMHRRNPVGRYGQ